MNQTKQPEVLNRPLRAGEHRGPAPEPQPLTSTQTGLLKDHHANGVFDEEIRRALKAYKIENKLTNDQLAKALGQGSPTIVSAYLNSQPRGNWQMLQKRAADLLENAKKRRGTERLPLRETPTTRKIAGGLELIRKTNDFGLVFGEAGVGKTCGVTLYSQRNPNSVFVTAAVWKSGTGGLVNALMEEVGWHLWDKKTARAEWLVARFAGTNRLIIVDNAHRLTRGSLAWLFDFHDLTGCPVALVGNPEVLQKILGSDQSYSRIGLCEEIKLESVEEIEEFTRSIMGDLAPELLSELGSEASERVAGKGHARALRKQLNLTVELLGTEQFKGQPRKAFAAAKTKLVTPEIVLGKGAK